MRLFFYLILLVLTACDAPNVVTQPDTRTAQVPGQPHPYNPETRLAQLGIDLPLVAPPVANYVHAVPVGNLLFLAGKGPKDEKGSYVTGKLGQDLSVEEGYAAARLAAVIQIAVLKSELGDLNRVKRIVSVRGMVNAAPDFTQHSQVINGFSDLMVEVFGEKGKHARAAVGMSSLPMDMAVEVELIVEFE